MPVAEELWPKAASTPHAGEFMLAPSLSLNEYQSRAAMTDQITYKHRDHAPLVLGLCGEIGSLLSETKKKQRDADSYIGYENNVLEETGDALWYLAVIAEREDIRLASLAAGAGFDFSDATFRELQPQAILPLNAPSVAFEKTLLRLAGAVGRLAETASDRTSHPTIVAQLQGVFKLLLDAANEAGITLADAALLNLDKANDRWPQARVLPPLFDESFPTEERLPRRLTVDIFERTGGNGKNYVVQRCNNLFIGDRLTDNIMKPDDYRFHDAFHYAYAAILGWSPVTRALFKLKRKSETNIDEGQDGARAILIEEGVATYVFGQAKELKFFEGRRSGDLGFTFLKSIRQFVRGYEVESCPLWLWEEAILAGNEAFRFLRTHRRGRLKLDLDRRRLDVCELVI